MGCISVNQVIVHQQVIIIALALFQGVAGGNNLILLNIDHGVHLDEACTVLQGHEVGGLIRNVQKQGEGGLVAILLNSAFRRGHGGIFFRTGAGVVTGFFSPLVHQNESDVAFVAGDGSDAGVHPDIVIQSDVVVSVGGLGTAGLAEQGIEEAVGVETAVVILLDQQGSGIHPVHPAGDVCHIGIGALAGNGVNQHCTLHIGTAEQANGLGDHGSNPVGGAFLVNFKVHIFKNVGRILEAEVAHQVTAEVFGGRVVDTLCYTNHIDLLGTHIKGHISGDTLSTVAEPLEEIGVIQIGDANRAILIIDLGSGLINHELADQVAQLTQLAVGQIVGRDIVQHGNLVPVDLVDLGGKVAGLHVDQLGIRIGPEDFRTGQITHQHDQQDQDDDGQRHRELLGIILEHFSRLIAEKGLGTTKENQAGREHQAQADDEEIELHGMDVQGRQFHIKEHGTCDGGQDQADDNPADRLVGER